MTEALKAEGWTGRIVTSMYKGVGGWPIRRTSKEGV